MRLKRRSAIRTSRATREKPRGLAARFRSLLSLIIAVWAAHVLNIALGGALTVNFGLVPRTFYGLDGIIAMPFLHGSWGHLAANTPPLLILGGLILLLAPDRFWRATLIAALLGGVLTWLFARQHNHIGASGVIFSWFGFLVALGLFERSWRALVGAAAALALYGAPTLIGLAPGDETVSWDGHLAGLVAGVAAAWWLRRPATRAPARPSRPPPPHAPPQSPSASAAKMRAQDRAPRWKLDTR